MGLKRKTETTLTFTSVKRHPTLAELAKFVEEAQLAGVASDASVAISDDIYRTTFSVTQALDM